MSISRLLVLPLLLLSAHAAAQQPNGFPVRGSGHVVAAPAETSTAEEPAATAASGTQADPAPGQPALTGVQEPEAAGAQATTGTAGAQDTEAAGAQDATGTAGAQDTEAAAGAQATTGAAGAQGTEAAGAQDATGTAGTEAAPEAAGAQDADEATGAPDGTAATAPAQASTEQAAERGSWRARRGGAERPGSLLGEYSRELLAVAGLLVLLLIRRLQLAGSRTESKPAHPQRSAPIKPEELGYAAFQALRSRSLESYRSLFLSGAEAGQVFGREGAEQYLDRRGMGMLNEAFLDLLAELPAEAIFHFAELRGDGDFKLHLLNSERREVALKLGKVVKVGAVLRLMEPATGDRTHTASPAPPPPTRITLPGGKA